MAYINFIGKDKVAIHNPPFHVLNHKYKIIFKKIPRDIMKY